MRKVITPGDLREMEAEAWDWSKVGDGRTLMDGGIVEAEAEGDPLGAARGIVIGVVLGAVCWVLLWVVLAF